MPFRFANIGGRSALVRDNDYFDLHSLSDGSVSSDPMEALQAVEALSHWAEKLPALTPTGMLEDVELRAPVPNPSSVYAVGLNYRKHAEESKARIPRVPMVFTKFPSCLVGARDDVILRSDYVDYEAELVVVVGRGGKQISREDAWDHVLGLTVGQDVSDRAAQLSHSPPQFNLGKSFDTFGPMGPTLVSADSLADPSALKIECRVNGELRQSDNTSDLIFDVPALVAYLSDICTLHAGDVIFTGTPSGVGFPDSNYLKDGDQLTTSVEGIGTLNNRCVRGPDHANADYVPRTLRGRDSD